MVHLAGSQLLVGIPNAGDDAEHAEWIKVSRAIDEGMAGDHVEVLQNL